MPARGDERSSRVVRNTPRFLAEAASLGACVRSLRKRQGWTLEQAAERMLLDLKHLQKIEAGTLNVTLVTLVRLADGLGIPVADLFRAERRRSKKNQSGRK